MRHRLLGQPVRGVVAGLGAPRAEESGLVCVISGFQRRSGGAEQVLPVLAGRHLPSCGERSGGLSVAGLTGQKLALEEQDLGGAWRQVIMGQLVLADGGGLARGCQRLAAQAHLRRVRLVWSEGGQALSVCWPWAVPG